MCFMHWPLLCNKKIIWLVLRSSCHVLRQMPLLLPVFLPVLRLTSCLLLLNIQSEIREQLSRASKVPRRHLHHPIHLLYTYIYTPKRRYDPTILIDISRDWRITIEGHVKEDLDWKTGLTVVVTSVGVWSSLDTHTLETFFLQQPRPLKPLYFLDPLLFQLFYLWSIN